MKISLKIGNPELNKEPVVVMDGQDQFNEKLLDLIKDIITKTNIKNDTEIVNKHNDLVDLYANIVESKNLRRK